MLLLSSLPLVNWNSRRPPVFSPANDLNSEEEGVNTPPSRADLSSDLSFLFVGGLSITVEEAAQEGIKKATRCSCRVRRRVAEDKSVSGGEVT